MTARRGECCGHDVARFWRRRPRSDQGDGLIGSPAGPDPGLAGEVAAFLEGRLLDHFAGAGHTVPAWAVLNRLAHADRPALVRLVGFVGVAAVATAVVMPMTWSEAFLGSQSARARGPGRC